MTLHYAVTSFTGVGEVIKVLVDHGADISAVDANGNSPLHLALENFVYPLKIVKLLSCTAVINHVSSRGTPLHCALHRYFPRINLDVINYFLDNGAEVNRVNKNGDTPLLYYVRKNSWDMNVLKLLLGRGASPNIANKKISPFLHVLDRIVSYSRYEPTVEYLKLIIAHALIECPDLDVEGFIGGSWCYKNVSQFAKKCVSEIQKMKKEYVANHTLYSLISRQQIQAAGNDKVYLADGIYNTLRILVSNKYPIYKEFISSKVGRSSLMKELEKLSIRTPLPLSNQHCVDQNLVELDFDSVCMVTQYLSKSDLINAVLAFADRRGSPRMNLLRRQHQVLLPGQVVQEVARRVMREWITSVFNSRSTTAAPLTDLQIQKQQLKNLVDQGYITYAFKQALTTKDVQLVLFLCESIRQDEGPTYGPFQHVLLFTGNQLYAHFTVKAEILAKYIEDVLASLDRHDYVIAVLEDIHQWISSLTMKNLIHRFSRNLKRIRLYVNDLIKC